MCNNKMHVVHIDFIRCPDLTVPNGNVVVIPNDQSLNSVATYSCNSDYSLEGGNSVRHCQSDREWNGTAPSCGRITVLYTFNH